MSQAERESNEVEERPTEPFMVHPKFRTEDLLEESDCRIGMVRGFLNLLALGKVGTDESVEEDLHSVAWGYVKLLDEAKGLSEEYSRRMAEKERPRREAAEKRARRAKARAHLVRMFAEADMKKGKKRADAFKEAREVIADIEAKGPLFVENEPAKGNGGAQ